MADEEGKNNDDNPDDIRLKEQAKTGMFHSFGESYKDIPGFNSFPAEIKEVIVKNKNIFRHKLSSETVIKCQPVNIEVDHTVEPPKSRKKTARLTPIH